MPKSEMLLIDAALLPEGYRKVVEAKQLLKSGRAKSLAEAARMTGISRSTFYKYKDRVFAYGERSRKKILTIHVMLEDRPGVLSGLLARMYEAGANILTLNQSIPVSGLAPVSFSMQLSETSTEGLLEALRSLDGVGSVEQILGD
ncbi:MAG TPA: ACT domain-containing protein [Ruminococcaceae bacterium]|nr:ACT domain-containing protein [Oscillospiraceae bacterium]